jgi:hypothetical protein
MELPIIASFQLEGNGHSAGNDVKERVMHKEKGENTLQLDETMKLLSTCILQFWMTNILT